VAETFPSLIGHLAYGAALGLTYVRLETRVRPWWLSRSEAETVRAYAAREQLLSSAPALWAFVVLIALTMPVLVGR
jgi:hypothetical protein